MATFGQWVEGARPRTLPAAVAPVLVGTAAAYLELMSWQSHRWSDVSGFRPDDLFGPGGLPTDLSAQMMDAPYPTSWGAFALRALLALLVALALQVGVNYSNDYSDGVRGTDEVRVGPVRLVGQRLATPHQVKYAAFACFGVAALAGLVLVLITQAWWLVLVGLAAIVAAWFYTGGPRPYGYAGLGELFVFVFFGLVAVVGTAYVQTLMVTDVAVLGGVACGALSVAILVANNLRDIPTDRLHGKHTLAVRLGDAGTRSAYQVAIVVPFAIVVVLAVTTSPWVLVALLAVPLASSPVRTVRTGAVGRDLIPVLAGTGRLLLVFSLLLSLGLVVAGARLF